MAKKREIVHHPESSPESREKWREAITTVMEREQKHLKRLKPDDIIIVQWIDAASKDGWHERKIPPEASVAICATVGFFDGFHGEGKTMYLSLYASKHDSDIAGAWAIPYDNIIKITKVKFNE